MVTLLEMADEVLLREVLFDPWFVCLFVLFFARSGKRPRGIVNSPIGKERKKKNTFTFGMRT